MNMIMESSKKYDGRFLIILNAHSINGYGNACFTTDSESYLLYVREFICHASIGYNWLFLVLRFERLTQDILTYVEMLQQILGKDTLSRCTIVFPHCRMKYMTRAQCVAANQDSPRIVHILENAHSVIFGDMDTLENDDSDDETRNCINRSQLKRRQRFMEELLERIDGTEDAVLQLNQSWYVSYWTNFKQWAGYVIERISGKSNELSKPYRLIAALKNDIPVTIYYESCSICLELIIEVWNQEENATMTTGGHVFHHECLKKWFNRNKRCPHCRADLRSLPERILGRRMGLHPIREQSKTPAALQPPSPPQSETITSPTVRAESPRPITLPSGEAEELLSSEESHDTNRIS